MRLPVHFPSERPLPFGAREHTEDERATVPLPPEAVARFDALLHELYADAQRADPDRIQRLANWLVTLPDEEAEEVLDMRLHRIADLRAMLADPDWDTDEPMRARLLKLLSYVDRDDDLIDDSVPLLGLLDDVLLIELAWPMFETELENYRDFRAYCSEQRFSGVDPAHREAWMQDRLAELALWRHQLGSFDQHYVAGMAGDRLFRVG